MACRGHIAPSARLLARPAFTPDGDTVAAAGSDGMVRLFNATNGAVLKEFVSVPLVKDTIAQARPAWGMASAKTSVPALEPETLAEGARVAALEIQPAQLK